MPPQIRPHLLVAILPLDRVVPIAPPLTEQNKCSILLASGTFGDERGPGQQIIVPGLVTRHPHSVLDPGSASLQSVTVDPTA